jgi:hypothetical protein
MIRAIALCLFAAPALAQDGCPTAADLARGVQGSYDTGRQELFRAGDRPEVVAMERTGPDGRRDRVGLARGFHWLTWEVEGSPTGPSAYEYGLPPGVLPGVLPVPAPGGRWATAVSDGSPRAASLRQVHAYGPLDRLEVGGCACDAIEALVVWHYPAHEPSPVIVTSRSLFLPELGFAVEIELQLADSPPEGQVPTAIRVAG